MFAQKDGKLLQPTEIHRNCLKVVELSALPNIRFHDIRHSHARLMLQQGVHPKVASERSGHSTIGITMVTYSTFSLTCKKEAAHQFEQLLE
jgi:integrase